MYTAKPRSGADRRNEPAPRARLAQPLFASTGTCAANPNGQTIERRKNRQTSDTSPSRRVFHTVMHKLVHRVIHRKRRKAAPVLPARENLISFAPCRRTGNTGPYRKRRKTRIYPANVIHETTQKNRFRRPDARLDRPALPLFPPAHQPPYLALHRNGHDRRAALRRRRAASRFQR